MNRKLEVVKEFRFEAAHVLPLHPGKCSRLHGHSWLMRVGVRAPINPKTGFVIDFIDLKALVQPLIDVWDHSFLGAHGSLQSSEETDAKFYSSAFDGYPTSENLVMFVVDYMQRAIALVGFPGEIDGDTLSRPTLSLVEIEETCTSRCTWRADG